MSIVIITTFCSTFFLHRGTTDTGNQLSYAQTNIPIDIGHVVEDVGVWPPLLPSARRGSKGNSASDKGKLNKICRC